MASVRATPICSFWWRSSGLILMPLVPDSFQQSSPSSSCSSAPNHCSSYCPISRRKHTPCVRSGGDVRRELVWCPASQRAAAATHLFRVVPGLAEGSQVMVSRWPSSKMLLASELLEHYSTNIVMALSHSLTCDTPKYVKYESPSKLQDLKVHNGFIPDHIIIAQVCRLSCHLF